MRSADGSFEIVVAPRARAGNWLPTGGVDRYVLVLRLYDTPVGVATRAAREAPMPAIAQTCSERHAHDPLAALAARRRAARRHRASRAVLLLPRTATQDAYSRLAPIAPVNTVAPLPQPTPQNAVMPFMDPAFATAVCRYDLSGGPLKLTVPVSPAYTSVSFYTRRGVAYYAINDRAAGRRLIELDLMTAAQRAELPEDEDVTAADRLIVESPSDDRPDRDARAGAGAWADAGRARRSRHGALQAGAAGARSATASSAQAP